MDEIKDMNTCFLSTFPPRGCGIASFTKDLSSAMDKRFNPKLKSKVIAINDEIDYNYGDKVLMKMEKEDLLNYLDIADKINKSENIKVVCVQHEFGLFGGEYGSYLIPFLDALNKPCVITFHTVLSNPDDLRKKTIKAISERCSAMIVIANSAVDILVKDYDVQEDKIYVVPHGIPNVAFQESLSYKDKLGLRGKIVLSTHGLLSRGKGIDYAIKALPELVRKYPDLIYLIIGQTHQGACYEDGELYRKELEELVERLKLNDHVKFVDRYVSLRELLNYILASDIYLFTNLEKDQISSGTLARAFGCGRVCVATPIVYAKEILSDRNGILAKFRNKKSFTDAIERVLSSPQLKKEIERNAYFNSRKMIWSNVALKYLKIFNDIVKLREEITEKFPDIKLDHIESLTDDIGIIQFANHTTPDENSGYTLDDNSRALIFSIMHNRIFDSKESLNLSKAYLNFVEKSQEESGNFRNQYRNEEERSNPYSEDSFGRAIWSLGFTINYSRNLKLIEGSKFLIENSFEFIDKLESPRSKAFTLIGLAHYFKSNKSSRIFKKIKELANDLVRLYNEQSSKDWEWFEPYLTYANAKLSDSLFFAYEATGDVRYLEIGKKTLDFLSDLCIINGKLYPIGEKGWFNRNNKRALFDQQPIDASSMVQAFLTAYRITKNPDYYKKAILSFNWFLGYNHLNQMVYDEASGGCYDGLGKHSLNFNQGAESTVEYLIARIMFEEK